MIGSIIGDVVGSCFEFENTDDPNFELFSETSTFTDDTVITVATADVIRFGGNFLEAYQKAFNNYPNRGWGGMFLAIASKGELAPYNSFGNGSAMRVSPVGWVCDNINDTMDLAKETSIVTHDHPEGVKGAQAVAMAIYLARNGKDKKEIMDSVSKLGYDLSKPLNEFDRKFDVTCQGTIPICMALFNETKDFEEAIRVTVAQGGDCDTNACIVGGIAEAFYGMPPKYMIEETLNRLPVEMQFTVCKFVEKFCYNSFEEMFIR
jgi:ADP-ribosyl-[dinitrogen reductase] hydrolase